MGTSRIGRWIGFDDNPLRRTSDRVQAWGRLVFIVAVAVSCCVGALAGKAAHERAARDDQPLYYPVTAEVLDPGPPGGPPGNAAQPALTRISWVDRDGVTQAGTVKLVTNDRTVRVWVDDHGNVSAVPHHQAGPATHATVGALSVTGPFVICLVLAYAAFRLALDRHRRAECDREWQSVEPTWRRQLL